jgi:hypothetical protein
MVGHRISVLTAVAAIGLGMTIGSLPAMARSSEALAEPIDAIWRQHRVNFDYHSFNVRYSCDGLQSKVRSILKAMGAHQDLEVAVNCPSGGLVTSASLLLTLKLPVVASEENVRSATTYTTQQELVARLRSVQLPGANDLQRFNAQLRTIKLTRDRRLNLDSGDCDLLEGVRDQLLPKLGISSNAFHCYDGGTRTRPKFEVAALVPVEPTPVALAAEPRMSISTVD